MAPTKSSVKSAKRSRQCVLIVDDEPELLELVSDIVGRDNTCSIVTAGSVAEAQRVIKEQSIQLALLDLKLPDGEGLSLLPLLREKQPTAEIVVITGHPSIDGAIGALRGGVMDLLPKPFTADHLRERVERALARQAATAKADKRLDRLRSAVRRLNVSRRMVSKKVDLLCNDLIHAYGEVSRQLDDVRTQESFRKLLHEAKDLEQMLCHAMDWILRQAGYCNVAVWLASEDGGNELGAYMKYTIPGDRDLTDAMRKGLLPIVHREGFVRFDQQDIAEQLTGMEADRLVSQNLMAVSCTYLGETLATVVAFRDARSPFTEEDGAMLRAISPIFAVALANVVRADNVSDESDIDEDSPFYDDARSQSHEDDEGRDDEDARRRKREQKERQSADWWKRGEPPPF